MRHFHYTYTSLTPSLPFLFYRPDRTQPTTPSTPPHLTSPHTNQRRNKAIDTRTHTNEAEDAEQESIAQLYLYVMYVMYVYHTPHGRPGARVELGRGIALFI
jgi:hypothetical protein